MTRETNTPTLRTAGMFILAVLLTTFTFVTGCSEEDQTADLNSGLPSVLGGVTITPTGGNPTCGDFNPDWEEMKIEPVVAGSFQSDDGYLTFTITDIQNKTFDWTSDQGVDAVFVKGGPGGNLYEYNPEATSDEGLNAFRNGREYGLSHISVCYDIEFARISITPDDTNEAGDPHTFDVLVEQKIGLSGSWEPVTDGTSVIVSLTPSNGATVMGVSDDCAAPGTVNGMCSVSFSSPDAGQITGHASATPNVDGSLIFVETDGLGENSGDAVKTFVDAEIDIASDGLNGIDEPHTFTVTASQDDGTGNPGPVPDGTIIDVMLIASGGATPVVSTDTCATGTTGGTCEVTFSSATAGTVDGHASMTITLSGLEITRETDGLGSNSPDSRKVFVAGTLIWHKVDDDGAPFGGTTFEVCRTHAWDSASSMMVDITDECISVLDNGSIDEDSTIGGFQLTGLHLGRYTIQESVGVPGYEPDPTKHTLDLTPAASVGIVSAGFVNTLDAWITIDPDDINGIGESHTFTVTVMWDDGLGNDVPAPDGTIVAVMLVEGGGANVVSVTDDCSNPGTVDGMCTVEFVSDSAGTVTGHASATISDGGPPVFVETDGVAPNSDDAVKTYVDGTLRWYKVDQDDTPFGGSTFEVCRTHAWDSSSMSFVDITDDCFSVLDNDGTDEDPDVGEFELTGLALGRYTVEETIGVPGYEPDTTKQTVDLSPSSPVGTLSSPFVNTFDAWITIEPDATNGIGELHTFSVCATWDDGQGTDVPVPDGTSISVTLTEAGGAAVSSLTDDCASPGTSGGCCDVSFTSNTAGTVTGHASVTLAGNLVETDGVLPNSDDAVKTFVSGTLQWYKFDDELNPLGGATFEVCRTHDWVTGTGMVAITPVCQSFVDNAGADEDPDDGEFLMTGLLLGTYTVEETVPPAGYVISVGIQTAMLTPSMPMGLLTAAFINTPEAPTSCSPGFWKNHWLFWDEASDPVASAAGFTTSTSFNAFFNLTAAESGFADSLTMLGALNLMGGDGAKLARHGVAGLLNIAAGLNYSYSTNAAQLRNEIRNAYLTNTFEPLATDLDLANNDFCPLP